MSTKYVLDAVDRRRLMATPAGWIATGLGSGLAPKAQGTFGSLAAIVPWLALHAVLPVWGWLLLIAVSFAVGVWACNVAGRIIGVSMTTAAWCGMNSSGSGSRCFPLWLCPAGRGSLRALFYFACSMCGNPGPSPGSIAV